MLRRARPQWRHSLRVGGGNDQKVPHLLPRIVGTRVMMPADLKRLHKYMLEVEHIGVISDEMREVVQSEWPELAHKLPPKRPRG